MKDTAAALKEEQQLSAKLADQLREARAEAVVRAAPHRTDRAVPHAPCCGPAV